MQRFGELTIQDNDGIKTYPTYCCGHCSDVVIMRPDRTRERKRCMGCGKLICERKQLCNAHCTPIHALARDHFETRNPEHKKYANALLEGLETVDEAEKSGLILL